MKKDIILKNGLDMIYLCGCAIHSIVPDVNIVEKMDLKEVYILSSRHLLQAITYMAVESFLLHNPEFKEKIPKELLYEWKMMKAKVIRSNILFEEERNKLLAFLEENKIWYVCLKGIVIQKYYKNIAMRQMSDNDILFDSTRQKDVYNYFVGSGYSAINYKEGCHDTYKKKPSLLFEMHHSLYTAYEEEKFLYDYYFDVKSRLKNKENCGYEYCFTDEDFYIHITTHLYKHFKKAGNGIRFLLDNYVYSSSKNLNFQYIEEELSKIGIKDFEFDIRKVAEIVFSKDTICNYSFDTVLSENEIEILIYSLFSGVFGNKINYIKNKVKRGVGDKNNGTAKYIFKRFFPDINFFQTKYPRICKYKILIPFVAVYRIFSRGIVNFNELKFEFKMIFKKK